MVFCAAFCNEGLRYLLATMYLSQPFLRNSLPMQGVSAIGQKLAGLVASSIAELRDDPTDVEQLDQCWE